jgi:hypothetical protein
MYRILFTFVFFFFLNILCYSEQTPIPVVEKPKDMSDNTKFPFLTASIVNGLTVPLSPAQKNPFSYYGGISSELSAGFIDPFTINVSGDFFPYAGLGISARLYVPSLLFYFGAGVKFDYDYSFFNQWNCFFFFESGLKILPAGKTEDSHGGFFIEPIVETGWRQPIGRSGYRSPAQQLSSQTNQGGIIAGNLEASLKICLGYLFY